MRKRTCRNPDKLRQRKEVQLCIRSVGMDLCNEVTLLHLDYHLKQ